MIPPTLRICGSIWQVVVTDDIDGDDDGETDARKHVIKIHSALCDDATDETFVHELLHAVCCAAGVRDGEMMDEEHFISRISSLLCETLKQGDFWPKD